MRRGVVLALSLVGALFLAAGVAHGAALDAARKLPVCGPAKGEAMTTTAAGRVYVLGRSRPGVFGCLAGGPSRRMDLVPGPTPDDSHIDSNRVVIGAPWVAYFRWTIEVDIGDMSLATMNLQTGRAWSCDLGPWSSSGGTGLGMTGLVTTGTGTAGWIGRRAEWPGRGRPMLEFDEVSVCRRGKVRRLDQGEIELDSLRLDGRVMSWVSSGRQRSVRLP